MNEYQIDPNQEFIALGGANLGTSFASGFAVTGSFSRSVVNNQARSGSPASGLIVGTMCILAIEYLTELFVYVPNASLAGVMILGMNHK